MQEDDISTYDASTIPEEPTKVVKEEPKTPTVTPKIIDELALRSIIESAPPFEAVMKNPWLYNEFLAQIKNVVKEG